MISCLENWKYRVKMSRIFELTGKVKEKIFITAAPDPPGEQSTTEMVHLAQFVPSKYLVGYENFST